MDVDRIIQGDALSVLKTLPSNSVDFVFADPPYGIKKAEWDQSYPLGFEKECLRVSRSGVAITPGQENIATCIVALGSDYKGVFAARNKNGMTFNKIGFGNWIPVVVAGKIKRGQDFFEFVVRGKKPDHPSPKPIDFMEKLLLRFTESGNTILDPFLGSGTTAVAAKQLGRHFIGIEMNPEYVKVAEQRLAEVQNPLLGT